MKSKYKTVLFDLDGTLSNSAMGVKMGIEAALREMNKPIPDLSDYSKYVGPPLLTTFQRLCGLNRTEAERAMLLYRRDYEQRGRYENYLYDGMYDLIKRLREGGALTAVATSKYEPFANWVIEYIGLHGMFDAVCGSTLDGERKEKWDIIAYAGKTLGIEIGADVCLIGDTQFDAVGAFKAGCDFIGVGYGFGTRQQIEQAGGVKIADSVDGLYPLLF